MANHKATKKAARQSLKRRLHNRYYKKTMRTALKGIHTEPDVKKKEQSVPQLVSMIDKLAKRGIIHKNKAANMKRKLAQHIAFATSTPSGGDTKSTDLKKTS